MKIIRKKEIEIYTQDNGDEPFTKWLDNLNDKQARYRIKVRLDRVASGNMGDCKPLTEAEGVHELRFFFGPGYRIYYGEDGDNIILLLCGGDKDSQKKDAKKAVKYWKDYLTR